MQYKIRQIVSSKLKAKIVHGVTIPEEIAVFFKDCRFTIERSGACIIMTSGATIQPTKKEVENYQFEDCRI